MHFAPDFMTVSFWEPFSGEGGMQGYFAKDNLDIDQFVTLQPFASP